jgi:hypothetical protein
MKLKNEIELENTRRKLASLEQLIAAKVAGPPQSKAHEWSLETMQSLARKLRAEIEEYEKTHQTA